MANWPRLALRALGKRLPTVDGTLRVRGVGGRVEIARDRFGIPHITAGDDADAWFAVGFCHGQDRAFQIETRLRLVRGTLAALTGPEGLPLDRLSRRIGFRRYGEEAAAALSPEHRRLAEAYARGVTAGADAGLRRRPHEFALLRARPTPYQAADALGFLALQAFALASNWDVELARLKILDPRRAGGPARPRPGLPGVAAGLRPARRGGRAGGRPGGRGRGPPGRGAGPGRRLEQLGHRRLAHPHRAARCWPTTRTCPRCCRRTGTCSTSPPPSGPWPGPPSPAAPRWPRGTTAIPPGGSPPGSSTTPTCSWKRSGPTGAACAAATASSAARCAPR